MCSSITFVLLAISRYAHTEESLAKSNGGAQDFFSEVTEKLTGKLLDFSLRRFVRTQSCNWHSHSNPTIRIAGLQPPLRAHQRERWQCSMTLAKAMNRVCDNEHAVQRRSMLVVGSAGALMSYLRTSSHALAQAIPSDETAQSARDFFLNAQGKQQPSEKADRLLQDLLTKQSSMKIRTREQLDRRSQMYGKGKWQVKYAPHMSTLEKVLGASFDVYYTIEPNGTIVSNVAFVGPFGYKGWLNTKGKWTSEPESERETAQSAIMFDQIWTDFNTVSDGPSPAEDKAQHVLPVFVQSVGKLAFVEDFSKFPVEYLDESVIVFLFKTTGTRIVAAKVSSA